MGETKRRNNDADTPNKRPKLEVQQTLYVQNLNDKVNRSIIKHNIYLFFSTYGDVLDINLKMRGQAHVIFESKESASRALRGLQDTELFGKPLRIDFAKEKLKCVETAERQIAEE